MPGGGAGAVRSATWSGGFVRMGTEMDCWSKRLCRLEGLSHCEVPLGAGGWFGAKGHWLDVGAPRPHAPRQGAQALHRSMELVCRASTAILNVPK